MLTLIRLESCCQCFLFQSLSPGYEDSLTAPPGGKEQHDFKKKNLHEKDIGETEF